MQTKPSNRCNCESDLCAASCAHPFAACHKLYHLTLIEAFGIKQTLCEDCLRFAQKRYGKNIVPLTSVQAGTVVYFVDGDELKAPNNRWAEVFVIQAAKHIIEAQAVDIAEAEKQSEACNVLFDAFFGPSWRTDSRIQTLLTEAGF